MSKAFSAVKVLGPVLAVGAMLGFTGEAEARWAAHSEVGQRLAVCATDLYVRSDIPDRQGYYIGVLHYPETFYISSMSATGQWVYGFAYGNVNKWGWVENGWFC